MRQSRSSLGFERDAASGVFRVDRWAWAVWMPALPQATPVPFYQDSLFWSLLVVWLISLIGAGAVYWWAKRRQHRLLHESEERYRALFAAEQDAIVIIDPATRQIVDVNEAALALYGYSRDEMCALHALDLSAEPDVSETTMSGLAAASHRVHIGRVSHKKKDGTVFLVEVSAGVFTLQSRKMIYAVFRDITERERAETALRASEELNRRILEALPGGLVQVSAEGAILYANDKAQEILGLSFDELTRRYVAHFDLHTVWEDGSPCPMEEYPVTRCLQTGQPQPPATIGFCRPDGKTTWAVYTAVPVLDPQTGQASGAVVTFLDLTERKHAEDERQRLIDELGAKNAELERFTYTVSHDLKSPLFTIKGFLGLLEKDIARANTERAKTDMEQIAAAADTMQRLLDELLELSRIGRLMNPPEAVSLSEVAHEALGLVAGRVEARGVTVEVEPAMPVVYADRVRLREVLQNLLENAVKFMGGQPAPHVAVQAARCGDEIVCSVRDNGVGIPPEHHEKVFGLFDRLDSNSEGTGIGLALAKRIVEVHGGRIWVESAGQGHGTTFHFALPRNGKPAATPASD